MRFGLSISAKTLLIFAICVVLALLTVIQSLSALSIDGGVLAFPTLYAIVLSSSNAHQLNPNFLFVFFGLVLNVALLATIYFGLFHLLRWVFRKTRTS